MTLQKPTAADAAERAIDALADTRVWLERAVIGLNLCPFAKAVHVRGRIRWVLSEAGDAGSLLADLERELRLLAGADPALIDTTLIVHPRSLADFADFNDFLGDAEALLTSLDLVGILQIASFHPHYRFADCDEDDISNFTNRAPHPTLHLLREDSISDAVAAFPDAEAIYGRNIDTLQRLGRSGWQALWQVPAR
jgi:hypothetical protein